MKINSQMLIALILWLFTAVLGLIAIFNCISKSEIGKPNPNYNIGTPAYDLSMLTDSKEMYIEHNQYVSVIGVDVMNLWLQNATNKRIISIVAFDRGIQGTTSSFLIVYSYY